MYVFLKALVFLVPLASAGLFLLFFKNWELFYYLAALNAVLTFVVAWRTTSYRRKLNHLLPDHLVILAFILSGYGVLAFIEVEWLKYVSASAIVLIQFFYLNSLYNLLLKESKMAQVLYNKLRVLIGYSTFLLGMFILYGLKDFIFLSFWWIVLLFIGYFVIISLADFIDNFKFQPKSFATLVIRLIILLELFLIIFVLPLMFYLKAVIVLIFYDFFTKASKSILNNSFAWRNFRNILILFSLILIIILATSPWI